MSILEPHPILFQTAWGPVTAHGFFFAVAAIVAANIFARLLVKAGIGRFVQGVEIAVLIFVIGLFGARLGYLISYRSEWSSFSQLFAVWQGGLVSFWGIAAGLIAALWGARNISGEYRTAYWRAVVLAGLAGWAIGRLGNYVIADSFGVLSAPWHAFYGRVPIQLFESLLCLCLFIVLYRNAKAAWLGIIGYLLGRLLIDTWRDEALLGPLHVSQWTIILILIVIIPLYVRRNRR
jgi:prolipoprotein diacylglyceryltransferase